MADNRVGQMRRIIVVWFRLYSVYRWQLCAQVVDNDPVAQVPAFFGLQASAPGAAAVRRRPLASSRQGRDEELSRKSIATSRRSRVRGCLKKLVLGFDYHSFDWKNYFSLNSKFVLRKCLLKNDKHCSSSKIAFTVRVKTEKSPNKFQKNVSVGLVLFALFIYS